MPTSFLPDQLIDGTGAEPEAGLAIRVDGETIAGVGAVQRDDDVVDLSGMTVLPGLIDAHVHLGISSPLEGAYSGEISAAERAADIFATCSLTLDEGFTSVRDIGGVDWGLMRALERGLVRGPRAITPGPILAQTGGHAHLAPPSQPAERWQEQTIPGLACLTVLCDSPDEVRRAARDAFRRGASFIKLNITGGVVSYTDGLDDTQFTVEEIRAAVVEAEARGTYVAVHAHNNGGVRNALEAGALSIEHGSQLNEEMAAMMAERGAWLVPTLLVNENFERDFPKMDLPQFMLERMQYLIPRAREAVAIAHQAGILVGSGTDLLGPDQSGRAGELALQAEILGPMEAILCATRNNSRILRQEDRVGTLEAGKLADLIAVDFDPLAEPAKWADPERVRVVVKGGEIVKDRRAG